MLATVIGDGDPPVHRDDIRAAVDVVLGGNGVAAEFEISAGHRQGFQAGVGVEAGVPEHHQPFFFPDHPGQFVAAGEFIAHDTKAIPLSVCSLYREEVLDCRPWV
ncbi:hypothetical protein D3C72_1808350 [compost metagenome]